MIPILLVSMIAVLQEDPPKATYDDTGDFRLLAMDLERRFGGRLRFAPKLPSKEVSISVRDAGYFEALDALCRGHGKATYFPEARVNRDVRRLELSPGSWVDYPASYHGHYKTALISLTRSLRRAPDGETGRVEAVLVLFAPPWFHLSRENEGDVEWFLDEARAADGRDLRAKEVPQLGDRVLFPSYAGRSDQMAASVHLLKDFDPDAGLGMLAGKVKLSTTHTRSVRLIPEAGQSAEIDIGTLTVDSVASQDSGRRYTLTLKPKVSQGRSAPALVHVFERWFRADGAKDWIPVKFPSGKLTFDLVTPPLPRAPEWIELRARWGRRSVEVPFRFNEVTFR